MGGVVLRTVLKLIPQLKPNEQLEVKKRLDFLLGNTTLGTTTITYDWLSEGIVSELHRRGLQRKLLVGYWRKWAPKGYAAGVLAVREQLRAAVRRPLTTGEQYALGRLAARALADYLQGVPGFGLKVMLQNISKVPEALDNSYPGYLADGMLGMLLSRR